MLYEANPIWVVGGKDGRNEKLNFPPSSEGLRGKHFIARKIARQEKRKIHAIFKAFFRSLSSNQIINISQSDYGDKCRGNRCRHKKTAFQAGAKKVFNSLESSTNSQACAFLEIFNAEFVSQFRSSN